MSGLVESVRKATIKLRKRVLARRGWVFSDIYRGNLWQGDSSVSGTGSDLLQTEVIRREIPELLDAVEAKSMLDLPCGDFFWMKETPLKLDLYIGGDIVPDLIKRNRRMYGVEPGCVFEVLDVVTSKLPKVDVVLCRDCLVHLSFAEVKAALKNIKRSGSTYLLTTTFSDRTENLDIVTGDWRTLNLRLPPFDFPEPLRLINEHCTVFDGDYGDKCLGLWRLDDLAIRAAIQEGL